MQQLLVQNRTSAKTPTHRRGHRGPPKLKHLPVSTTCGHDTVGRSFRGRSCWRRCRHTLFQLFPAWGKNKAVRTGTPPQAVRRPVVGAGEHAGRRLGRRLTRRIPGGVRAGAGSHYLSRHSFSGSVVGPVTSLHQYCCCLYFSAQLNPAAACMRVLDRKILPSHRRYNDT